MPPHMSFGSANVGIAWSSKEDLEALTETLAKLGINHIDTAARYPPTEPGLAEKLLGKADFAGKGFKIDTKIYVKAWDAGGSMSEGAADASVQRSLQALNTNKIHTLYCHGPDRETPVAEQTAVINKHFENGVFTHFGVSNFSSAQLEQWLDVCSEKGYAKPSVYQGQYNLLCRGWEENQLFPLLRRHGISFSAFSPLAGGFLTGKLTFAEKTPEDLVGTRFDPAAGNLMGKAFRHWYDKASMHEAMRGLKGACDMHGVRTMDAALRWVMFHSALRDGDEIVFGATNTRQIEEIVAALRDGPLPEGLAPEIAALWDGCKVDGGTIIEY